MQIFRLGGEAVAGGSGFLHHGGVFLGGLIHDVDGLIDFPQTIRLFARSFNDGRDIGVDLAHL